MRPGWTYRLDCHAYCNANPYHLLSRSQAIANLLGLQKPSKQAIPLARAESKMKIGLGINGLEEEPRENRSGYRR